MLDDKLSMAHSLEARVPFLDNDLVDFSMRLPVRMKINRLDALSRIDENEPASKVQKYYQRTSDGKRALRKVMAAHVPNEITEGIKQGFSAPDASWFKGESIEYVRRTLFQKDARIYEYFDPKVTKELVQEHIDGRHNRRLLIWSLLNFEQFCHTFLA